MRRWIEENKAPGVLPVRFIDFDKTVSTLVWRIWRSVPANDEVAAGTLAAAISAGR